MECFSYPSFFECVCEFPLVYTHKTFRIDFILNNNFENVFVIKFSKFSNADSDEAFYLLETYKVLQRFEKKEKKPLSDFGIV